MPRCGFKPLGYTPCTRELGHEGPCAHDVDLDAVAVDLQAIGIDVSSAQELDEFFWKTLEGIYGKRAKA